MPNDTSWLRGQKSTAPNGHIAAAHAARLAEWVLDQLSPIAISASGYRLTSISRGDFIMRDLSIALVLLAFFIADQAFAQCAPKPGAPPNWCMPHTVMPRPMGPQGAVPTSPNSAPRFRIMPGRVPSIPSISTGSGSYGQQLSEAQRRIYRYTCEINDDEDDAGDVCDVYSRYPYYGKRCRCHGERGTIR